MRPRPAMPRWSLALLTAAVIAVPAGLAATVVNPSDPVTSAAVVNAAAALYGSSDLQVYQASDDAFAAAFPGFALYIVMDNAADRIPRPAHAMAYRLGTGWDVTTQFNSLLAAAGAVLTSGTVLTYAKAYAQTGNTELQQSRAFVDSSDSGALGHTVQDPQVTPLLDGFEVTLSTWSAENGVVADWTFAFTFASLSQAKWRVAAVGAGDFGAEVEALNFRVGHWLVNSFTPGHGLDAFFDDGTGLVDALLPQEVLNTQWLVMTEATATNFDGSRWVAFYPAHMGPQTPASLVEVGRASVEGGAFSYNIQVSRNSAPSGCAGALNPDPNWGFESKDNDCTLRVHILDFTALICAACIIGGNEVNVYIAPYVKEFVNALGQYLNPAKHDIWSIQRVIMGHEHFHNLQYVITQWNPWDNVWLEGMARFTQTPLEPDTEYDPTALFYGTAIATTPNGVNYYMLNPQVSMCEHMYDFAIYWGYLFQHDGGIATIKSVLHRIDEVAGFQPCNTYLANAISTALASRPGAHDTHAEAVRDFQVAVYERDFHWGREDGSDARPWGDYMLPVKREIQTGATGTRSVGAWGLQYVQVVNPNAYQLKCTVADANWETRLFRTHVVDGAFVEDMPCGVNRVISGAQHVEVVPSAARLSTLSGSWTVSAQTITT